MKGKYLFIHSTFGHKNKDLVSKICYKFKFVEIKKWALEILMDTDGGRSGWKDSIGKGTGGPIQRGGHEKTKRQRRGFEDVVKSGWLGK